VPAPIAVLFHVVAGESRQVRAKIPSTSRLGVAEQTARQIGRDGHTQLAHRRQDGGLDAARDERVFNPQIRDGMQFLATWE
jgi:hypothetical protein